MTISITKAKALCSASELALVTASTRKEIGKLSAAELGQAVTRARKLRDKWRDQAAKQRRATQAKQGARETAAGARSTEKAELFGEVLDRLTAQLAKVEARGDAVGERSRKTPPRRTRALGHRAARAAVRESLGQTRKEMEERSKASRSKASAKPAAAAKPAGETAATPPAGKMGAAASTKTGKRPRKPAASTGPVEPPRAGLGLTVSKLKQLRVAAKAKKNRVKSSGAVRIQKHLSAANKRRQARRDSR